MIDPWIHDTVDPVSADIVDYICPIVAVFAGRECSAAQSVVFVSKIWKKAKNSACRSAALVLHSKLMVRLARSPVFCPAQDCHDLAEKAIS